MKPLTEKQKRIRAEGIAKGAAVMAEIRARPGAEDSYLEWKKEYDATVAMHRARRLSGLTQERLAERMEIPRSNVSRIERGANITLATFSKYLRACGFELSFDIRPLRASPFAEAMA